MNIDCLDNVSAYNIAISNNRGKKSMYLTPHSNWGTLLDTNDEEVSPSFDSKMKKISKEHILVGTMSVDEFVSSKMRDMPDMIKMDIEGYEKEVITGMTDTLHRSHKIAWYSWNYTQVIFQGKRY